MSVLVLAEHNGAVLGSATARVITAAKALGGEVVVLVAGPRAVAEQAAKLSGVSRILHADAPHHADMLAEDIAPLLVRHAAGCTHVLAAATTTGKDILPRAAALLDAPQVSDVIRVESANTFVRPIYAGNALETVRVQEKTVFLTVRPTAFAACGEGGGVAIASVEALPASEISVVVSREATATDRPDLLAARVVVSGGRGVGSAENFVVLGKLADRLGAAVGASRAAVDAGFVPNDLQVGQTGKVVAPELYLAFGISGAIQHLAGIKDSKVIVAVNKDENAPIFEVADYGLVADWQATVNELLAALA